MKELVYKSYEKFSLFSPDSNEFELHFSDVPKEKRDTFIYVKGKVLSRNVNKKMVRFTENALRQAVNEFKPKPMLIEHSRSLKDMVGTLTSFELNDNGLFYFSAIPNIDDNRKYIDLMKNDFAGLIRTSIGGTTTSITCNICQSELWKDMEHQFGKKYDGQLAFGNVNNWKTKEVSFTIFPADPDTSTQIYQTGFSELDEILMSNTSEGGETLLNEEHNINGEQNMAGEVDSPNSGDKLTIDEKSIMEIVQSSLPDLETFATKDEIGEIKTLLQSLVKDRQAEKEAKLTSKRLELSKMTGKDVEKYAGFSENVLDAMIEREQEINQGVPNELGVVESNQGGRAVSTKLSDPEIQKEAARIILGIAPTSQKVNAHYGMYSATGRRVDVYDRLEKELSLKFSENDEGDN